MNHDVYSTVSSEQSLSKALFSSKASVQLSDNSTVFTITMIIDLEVM